MFSYIIKRILWIIPIMVGVITIIFVITAITPGDPIDQIVGISASQEVREAKRVELGLDKTVAQRWANYLIGVMTKGDLGISYNTGCSISEEIATRIPVTLILALVSVAISLLIGVPLGVLSAIKQYTWVDNLILVFSMLAVSMPSFWLGLLLMMLFSVNLHWLPTTGISSISGWVLPIFVASFASIAMFVRYTRTSLLEIMRQDYIGTARAKGQKESVVIWKHMLRNALIPIVSSIGINLGNQLGGNITIEAVFALPGIGTYVTTAINNRNYSSMEGGILVIAIIFTIINLIVDIVYVAVDPRLKTTLTQKKASKKDMKKLLALEGAV